MAASNPGPDIDAAWALTQQRVAAAKAAAEAAEAAEAARKAAAQQQPGSGR
jgi:hypothetical protein